MQVLKGKNALITGGGRGIGKTIAEFYAREGADIFLIARTALELEATKKELEKYGTKVITHTADVSKTTDVAEAIDLLQKSFDKIDVLVNAAGIYGPIGKLENLDPDQWMQTFSVNIFGTMLMCRAILPFMKKRSSGRIINFSGGGEGAFPRFTAYASSKGAVIRFSESLAEEVKNQNIMVNAIAPGAVNTALLEAVLAAGPEKAGKEFYEKSLKQKEEGGTPPEKAAELCVFLASDESSGLTGKIFSAKWDNWKEFPKYKKEIMDSNIYTLRRVKPENRGYNWK